MKERQFNCKLKTTIDLGDSVDNTVNSVCYSICHCSQPADTVFLMLFLFVVPLSHSVLFTIYSILEPVSGTAGIRNENLIKRPLYKQYSLCSLLRHTNKLACRVRTSNVDNRFSRTDERSPAEDSVFYFGFCLLFLLVPQNRILDSVVHQSSNFCHSLICFFAHFLSLTHWH